MLSRRLFLKAIGLVVMSILPIKTDKVEAIEIAHLEDDINYDELEFGTWAIDDNPIIYGGKSIDTTTPLYNCRYYVDGNVMNDT